jgi:hypothetical protein
MKDGEFYQNPRTMGIQGYPQYPANHKYILDPMRPTVEKEKVMTASNRMNLQNPSQFLHN